MADQKNDPQHTGKVEVEGIESIPAQDTDRELSSANSPDGAATPIQQGDDPSEKVPLATIMAIFVSFHLAPAVNQLHKANSYLNEVHGIVVCSFNLVRIGHSCWYSLSNWTVLRGHRKHRMDSWRLVGCLGCLLLNCRWLQRYLWSSLRVDLRPSAGIDWCCKSARFEAIPSIRGLTRRSSKDCCRNCTENNHCGCRRNHHWFWYWYGFCVISGNY